MTRDEIVEGMARAAWEDSRCDKTVSWDSEDADEVVKKFYLQDCAASLAWLEAQGIVREEE